MMCSFGNDETHLNRINPMNSLFKGTAPLSLWHDNQHYLVLQCPADEFAQCLYGACSLMICVLGGWVVSSEGWLLCLLSFLKDLLQEADSRKQNTGLMVLSGVPAGTEVRGVYWALCSFFWESLDACRMFFSSITGATANGRQCVSTKLALHSAFCHHTVAPASRAWLFYSHKPKSIFNF